MKRITRSLLVIATFSGALAGLWLLSFLLIQGSAGAMPAITPTSSITPTPTATATAVFTATLRIEPDRPQVTVGDVLTLTIDIDVSEGCQYPVFELSVYQDKSEPALFAHIDPPVDMITGPITIPSVWTFQAIGAGTATFDARTFGERYCNDFWNWHYLSGESGVITVTYPIRIWLPVVSN